MNGKGSRPRPLGVSRKTFEANWEKAFGKKTRGKNPNRYKAGDICPFCSCSPLCHAGLRNEILRCAECLNWVKNSTPRTDQDNQDNQDNQEDTQQGE